MKHLFYLTTKILFVWLALSNFLVFAVPSSDGSKNGMLRIDFLSAPDWIEVDHIEKIPEKLVISLVRENHDPVPISYFTQEGPAFPELVSVFKSDVDGRRTLFVIVKWRYYLSAVDTEGDYYEVRAYQVDATYSSDVKIMENKKLSNIFGSGFDGRREGKNTSFRFKDATSVRNFLYQSHRRSKR